MLATNPLWPLAGFQDRMNLTAGSPVKSIRFRQPPQPLCNTPIPRIMRRDSAASIRTAPGLTAGDMALAGGPSASVPHGPLLPMDNGSWIPLLAVLGSASNPGAGRPIITVAG